MPIPDPRGVERARALRRSLTFGERALWSFLRQGRAQGFAIRRQHPIGPYVVDFACRSARLVIELDGLAHWIRERDDPRREAFLRREGWEVVHVSEAEVMRDAAGVAERVFEAVRRRRARDRDAPPPPSLLRWSPSPGCEAHPGED